MGAAIPASSSALSRDSARLKHKLVSSSGKKRMRDEEDKSVVDSDDENESRARAITKKVKRDPFGEASTSKKKKGKHTESVYPSKMPSIPPGSTQSELNIQAVQQEAEQSVTRQAQQVTSSGVQTKSPTVNKEKKLKSAKHLESSPLIGAAAPSTMRSASASSPKNGK